LGLSVTNIVLDTARRWLGSSPNGIGMSDNIVVLDDLSGYVESGQFMVILGPSGMQVIVAIWWRCKAKTDTLQGAYHSHQI
jgi:hypothetical protein